MWQWWTCSCPIHTNHLRIVLAVLIWPETMDLLPLPTNHLHCPMRCLLPVGGFEILPNLASQRAAAESYWNLLVLWVEMARQLEHLELVLSERR